MFPFRFDITLTDGIFVSCVFVAGKKVLILFQNGNILYCFLFNMEICDHNLWLKNTMYLHFLSEKYGAFCYCTCMHIYLNTMILFPLHIHLLIFLFQFTAAVGHCTILLGKWSLTFQDYIMVSSSRVQLPKNEFDPWR